MQLMCSYTPYTSHHTMPQTKPVISVENVMATGDMAQKIDLNDIQERFAGTEYHPEQFPGLVFRLARPKTATLIFRTCKMVCTGSKSKEQAEKAINEVVRKLRKSGVKIKNDPVVVIQNIVASINLAAGYTSSRRRARSRAACTSRNSSRG